MKEETEQMYKIILSWPVTTEGVVFSPEIPFEEETVYEMQ